MKESQSTCITPGSAQWPSRLSARLGVNTPTELATLGNIDLLQQPQTALFCSARCPGSAILATYDQAAQWRDTERCIISGFHSPVEKECLQILLRGDAPVILCPARRMLERLPAPWAIAVAFGRMLVLSAFQDADRRVTADLAVRRNRFVAALADEHYFAHIAPGSHTESLAQEVADWSGRSHPLNRNSNSIERPAKLR